MKVKLLTIASALTMSMFFCVFLLSCSELGTDYGLYGKKTELKDNGEISKAMLGKYPVPQGTYESFEFLPNGVFIVVERPTSPAPAVNGASLLLKTTAGAHENAQNVHYGSWEVENGKVILNGFGELSGISTYTTSSEVKLGFTLAAAAGNFDIITAAALPVGVGNNDISKIWLSRGVFNEEELSTLADNAGTYTVLFTRSGTYFVLDDNSPTAIETGSATETRHATFTGTLPDLTYTWEETGSTGNITVSCLGNCTKENVDLVVKEKELYYAFEKLPDAEIIDDVVVGNTVTGKAKITSYFEDCSYIWKADGAVICDNSDTCLLPSAENISFSVVCAGYESDVVEKPVEAAPVSSSSSAPESSSSSEMESSSSSVPESSSSSEMESSSSASEPTCDGYANLATYCPNTEWEDVKWEATNNNNGTRPACFFATNITNLRSGGKVNNNDVRCNPSTDLNWSGLPGCEAQLKNIVKADGGYYVYMTSTSGDGFATSFDGVPFCIDGVHELYCNIPSSVASGTPVSYNVTCRDGTVPNGISWTNAPDWNSPALGTYNNISVSATCSGSAVLNADCGNLEVSSVISVDIRFQQDVTLIGPNIYNATIATQGGQLQCKIVGGSTNQNRVVGTINGTNLVLNAYNETISLRNEIAGLTSATIEIYAGYALDCRKEW